MTSDQLGPASEGFSAPWLLASIGLALMVMVGSLFASMYIAFSEHLGGENGVLFWCVVLPGNGLRLARGVGLFGPRGIADIAQCAILTTLFYVLGIRWKRHRRRKVSGR